MLEQFIGKRCEVTVAFSGSTAAGIYKSASVITSIYTGLLISEDDKFIKMNGEAKSIEGMQEMYRLRNFDKPILINKDYVIAITIAE